MSQAAQRLEPREGDPVLKLRQASGFNPADFPICTRTPKRLGVPTAWLGHTPFAMGLVAMTRPRVLVELGTQWGVSYAAFCQAVKELRLPTRCYAVDTWKGCPHSGSFGSADLADLRRHNDAEYALFSELIQGTFDEALPRFADGSVDVLHIDGYHSYDAVTHDFETWLPKMSDFGVVLFHDNEIRWEPSYGVWRFWDEVKQQYPHFEFYHAFGLGVLAVGKSVPEGLRPLLDAPKGEADRIRDYFANLGERLERLEEVVREKARQAEELAIARNELASALTEKARLAGQLAATQQHYGRFRFRVVGKLAVRTGLAKAYRAARSAARAAAAAVKR